ncbi:hypothetical protein K0T92_10690 [Paenibacillus oenotherae]|uniref:Uncharacterized protein n=1 Tax=Paenibacillus oenotherae TaxID=1435645 RepID=A0ABS7D5Q5_9BACL|nr:hypothetical protein [Paenibacillus oenotherae]MBW7475215.1 hypothetical protein [Paenibacillus oenotherae]
MADALKGAVVIVLLIIVFVIYPAYRQAENVEDNMRDAVNSAVVEFVDTARSKGYIEVSDYNLLLRSLDASRAVFDVQLEYYKKNIQPNYTNPDDIATFQDSFNVRYDGYFSKDILNVLYPDAFAEEDDPSRRWNMHVGDLINVRISTRETTLASRMRSFLFNSAKTSIYVKYGGMVRSEAP